MAIGIPLAYSLSRISPDQAVTGASAEGFLREALFSAALTRSPSRRRLRQHFCRKCQAIEEQIPPQWLILSA